MLCTSRNGQWWRSRSLLFTLCLSLNLLLSKGCSHASVSQFGGICSNNDKYYKPGESFSRGCDKCYCHELGFFCFAPMKPTSWPKKCRRLQTKCGYVVVYKENPQRPCQAYSWIG